MYEEIEERYFFDQDGSMHWYVIPLENKKQWDEWKEIDEDDERSWDVPIFAKMVDGGISSISFSDWKDEK